MSVLYWPSDLPQEVLAKDFSASPRDGRLAARTDTGPGRVRRRTSGAVAPVACRIITTWDGRMRFERFWNEETRGGVLPFLIRDQLLDGLPLGDEGGDTVTTEDDDILLIPAWWLVQFATQAAPVWTAEGSPWLTCRFSLNVLP